MQSHYPYTRGLKHLAFLVTPGYHHGCNLTETDQNRLTVVTRRTVEESLLRTFPDIDDLSQRKNRMIRQSIVVQVDNKIDSQTACGIIYRTVCRSTDQIKTLPHHDISIVEQQDQAQALELLLSKGCPNGEQAEFAWIPVQVVKEKQGTMAEGAFNYPVLELLKEFFPDAAKDAPFFSLIARNNLNEPYALVAFPETSYLVLITDSNVKKL